MGEMIGTAALVMLGTSATCRERLASPGASGHSGVPALAWAGASFVGLLLAASLGGGHLNPAVTLGLSLAGHFPGERVQSFMLAQAAGAVTGSGIMWLCCLPLWGQARGQVRTLDCFCVQRQVRAPLGTLLVEIVGSALLVAAVLALRRACGADAVTSAVEGRGVLLWALGGGGLALALGLSLGGGWGMALNPVRDLGPRVAHALLPMAGKGSSEWHEAWPAVVGPLVGAWMTAAAARMLIPA
jgi:glycerol uptake facilitator protein